MAIYGIYGVQHILGTSNAHTLTLFEFYLRKANK